MELLDHMETPFNILRNYESLSRLKDQLLILLEFPYIWWGIFFYRFKDFLFAFQHLTLGCFSLLTWSILAYWMHRLIFFFKYFFLFSISSPLAGPIMHMLICLIVSHISQRLFIFPQSFPSQSSDYIIFIDLSWNLQILSSPLNLLFIPSSEFFTSATILFNCKNFTFNNF